jgi:hypothetical protein
VAIGRALASAGVRPTRGPRHVFVHDRIDGIDAELEQLDRFEPLTCDFRVQNSRDRERIDSLVDQRRLKRYYDEDLAVPSGAGWFLTRLMRRARRMLGS